MSCSLNAAAAAGCVSVPVGDMAPHIPDVRPPPGVEVTDPTAPHWLTIWRFWTRGQYAQIELWLSPPIPGEHGAAVTCNAGFHTFRDPDHVATVEAMWSKAREWLTAAVANDGAQLALSVEDPTP